MRETWIKLVYLLGRDMKAWLPLYRRLCGGDCTLLSVKLDDKSYVKYVRQVSFGGAHYFLLCEILLSVKTSSIGVQKRAVLIRLLFIVWEEGRYKITHRALFSAIIVCLEIWNLFSLQRVVYSWLIPGNMRTVVREELEPHLSRNTLGQNLAAEYFFPLKIK